MVMGSEGICGGGSASKCPQCCFQVVPAQTVAATSIPAAEAGKSKEKSPSFLDSLAAITSVILQYLIYCYGLNCVPPKNLWVETLPPNVMVCGDGTFGEMLRLDEVIKVGPS